VFVITLGHAPPTLNWAVAGLRPSLGGILAGRLPVRSIVGATALETLAYSVCPRASTVPVVMSIVVVALPRRLTLRRGFDASTLFTGVTKPGGHHGSVVMLARKLTTSGAKGGASSQRWTSSDARRTLDARHYSERRRGHRSPMVMTMDPLPSLA